MPGVADSQAIQTLRRRLGARLAGYREAAGYTQRSFTARLVGYSRSTVANVETGRQNVGRGFWERCDELLATAGALAADYDTRSEQRRLHEPAGDVPRPEGAAGSVVGANGM
jgi:transcriptional regulator with XRE-family HTH domain